jgi:hypothetical protein
MVLDDSMPDLAGSVMMPSVRLKPTAKSSKIGRRRHHHRMRLPP